MRLSIGYGIFAGMSLLLASAQGCSQTAGQGGAKTTTQKKVNDVGISLIDVRRADRGEPFPNAKPRSAHADLGDEGFIVLSGQTHFEEAGNYSISNDGILPIASGSEDVVTVQFRLNWPATRLELPINREAVKLTASSGATYGPALWNSPILPICKWVGRAFKRCLETIESVPFRVPKNAVLKSLCIGDACFDL